MVFLKTIQQIILPSALIPIVIAFGFALTFRKKNLKTGKAMIAVGLGLYYLLSIAPVSDLLLFPLERDYESVRMEDIEEANKIVLLLGGRESDVLRASEVLRIAHLANQKAVVIISGTDPTNPRSEEALAVRNFFTARGVPEENIVIEGRSRNTWENVRNIKEIVEDEPFFLVTSAYHMKRSMKEFEKTGASPIPAPIDFKRRENYGFASYFPNARNLRNSDLAIHEYFGIIFYKFL